ncbi:MAG: amidohydrolase family protein [Pirellulaceae bacterium]|nr:amidohydrolase family protein [Pirellulaceae bacterium]
MTTPASSVRAFRARWIVPGDGPPIRDGVLAMAGQLIQYVGPDAGDFPAEDLGNVAILPGLVNSHTHLEFSGLEAPLGQSGMRFTDWIAAVVQHRRARDADGPVERSQAIRRGIIESLGHGVTAIGEISSGDWPTGAVSELPMEGIVFRELLGASPERIEAEHQSARTFLEFDPEAGPAPEQGSPAPVPFSPPSGWLRGLSPHAPYSVHPELLSRAVRLARTFDVPLAMHLAESPEEIELLAERRGPFVPLLESLNAWHPRAIPSGLRPMDILRVLADAPRVLVVHGNYLSDDEIDFLGANSDRMSVVFCPRTHGFFQHRRYPLARMLAAGVRIALGTDSRASTPDLSLLAEMRQVARDYSEIPPARILQMATINGARALGLDGHCGTLVVGKHANLAIVALPDGETDCYESLLASDTPVTATVYRGELIAGF